MKNTQFSKPQCSWSNDQLMVHEAFSPMK